MPDSNEKSSSLKLYLKTCLNCGASFSAKKPFAKYCSVPCKTSYLKTFKRKKPQILKLYRKQFLKGEVLDKINQWSKIPYWKKKVIIDSATRDEALVKLKELGYSETLAFKPLSFSKDGKLMVTMNIIQKYKIEILV